MNFAKLPELLRTGLPQPSPLAGGPGDECLDRQAKRVARACARTKRKRPGNRGAPKFQPRSEHQAATLVALTSRSLLELVIGIARGFIASGISRTRSTCRSPFSKLAPLTLT